jgi:protein-L-isoaspartate(D-aspartate) O-methyltransferase
MADFAQLRARMVDFQIAGRGIRSPAVLDAMRAVPRDRFVPEGLAERAYDDSALPIGEGQTISQPFIVAMMVAAAEVNPGDRVLEVGAGSGYAAAVLAQIAGQVYAIERNPELAKAAERRIAELGYGNITLHVGDGTLGLPENAPFDAILVAAAGPEVPLALKQQLAIGGRLVIPIGNRGSQQLCKVTRLAVDDYAEEGLLPVTFVPLIGSQGWPGEGRDTEGSTRR